MVLPSEFKLLRRASLSRSLSVNFVARFSSSINYVRWPPESKKPEQKLSEKGGGQLTSVKPSTEQEPPATPSESTSKAFDVNYRPSRPSLEELEKYWELLFAEPNQFWDNRNRKLSEKSPDFTHKETRTALWIDSKSTPLWVNEELDKLQSRTGQESTFAATAKQKQEELWTHYFENPADFKDLRPVNNPKAPSFKRKSDGESLWLDSWSTPAWVSEHFSQPSNNQLASPTPSSVEENLPTPRFQNPSPAASSPASTDLQWDDLFFNYKKYYDNRANKRSPRAPDFKHKETGLALWLNSYDTPAWVNARLSELPPAPGA